MRIKICGLTREEDAALAERLGAWALGFIFYPQSKRYLTPDAARPIIAQRTTPCVGVFVNQTEEAITLSQTIPFEGLQLHGDETPEECLRVKKSFPGFIVKALRPETEDNLKIIETYKNSVDYILIDTAVKGEWGGSGKISDWALAARATEYGVPVILAGGLNVDNIGAAQQQVKFHAADLASGVEAAPGIKDAQKLHTLFSNV